jgi:hypothetical protein
MVRKMIIDNEFNGRHFRFISLKVKIKGHVWLFRKVRKCLVAIATERIR